MNIELSANTLVGTEIKQILLPENSLKLKFNSNLYRLSTLLVSARNGNKEIKKKLEKPFEIDLTELLFPGRIECEISLIEKCEAVKTWRMQDVIVKEINHKYEPIPEIEELKGAVKEIVKILKENNLM